MRLFRFWWERTNHNFLHSSAKYAEELQTCKCHFPLFFLWMERGGVMWRKHRALRCSRLLHGANPQNWVSEQRFTNSQAIRGTRSLSYQMSSQQKIPGTSRQKVAHSMSFPLIYDPVFRCSKLVCPHLTSPSQLVSLSSLAQRRNAPTLLQLLLVSKILDSMDNGLASGGPACRWVLNWFYHIPHLKAMGNPHQAYTGYCFSRELQPILLRLSEKVQPFLPQKQKNWSHFKHTSTNKKLSHRWVIFPEISHRHLTDNGFYAILFTFPALTCHDKIAKARQCCLLLKSLHLWDRVIMQMEGQTDHRCNKTHRNIQNILCRMFPFDKYNLLWFVNHSVSGKYN